MLFSLKRLDIISTFIVIHNDFVPKTVEMVKPPFGMNKIVIHRSNVKCH
jgi:hypothetical protein